MQSRRNSVTQMSKLARIALVVVLLVFACADNKAFAHPHVFVTVKSELVFDDNGLLTGIRHAWTFDDMFSVYATQGIEQKEKGVFSREELAPLAEINITSMKDFDYFTRGEINGKPAVFKDPVDYRLEYSNQFLTLHFTLPLEQPVKVEKLTLDIYDPVYFVAFDMGEKDPVTFVAAPAQCVLTVAKPEGANVEAKSLSESFFDQLGAGDGFGAQFSNTIVVTCE